MYLQGANPQSIVAMNVLVDYLAMQGQQGILEVSHALERRG